MEGKVEPAEEDVLEGGKRDPVSHQTVHERHYESAREPDEGLERANGEGSDRRRFQLDMRTVWILP